MIKHFENGLLTIATNGSFMVEDKNTGVILQEDHTPHAAAQQFDTVRYYHDNFGLVVCRPLDKDFVESNRPPKSNYNYHNGGCGIDFH